jgi:hypothetical protein
MPNFLENLLMNIQNQQGGGLPAPPPVPQMMQPPQLPQAPIPGSGNFSDLGSFSQQALGLAGIQPPAPPPAMPQMMPQPPVQQPITPPLPNNPFAGGFGGGLFQGGRNLTSLL